MYLCYARGEKVTIFAAISVQYIQNSEISQGYISRILLHFAIKRCHSTNGKISFLAVVKDFLPAKFDF